MNSSASALVTWGARILGIAVVLFIGAFSLDALDEGLAALLIHLIPASVLLAAVAFAWRGNGSARRFSSVWFLTTPESPVAGTGFS
jgi:hypothetical protein